MGDVYSHRPVGPEELPSVMRKHIYTGAMGVVYVTIVMHGMFFVDYGNRIGLSYWHWGVLRGAVTLSILFQLLGARISALSGERKKLWFRAGLAGRLLRGAAFVLSFCLLPYNASAAIASLICLTAMGAMCGSFSHPPWLSWLSDIIPRGLHGAFVGRRRAWTSIATAAVLLPCGLFADRIPESARLEVLLAIFFVAFAVGYVDLFIHRTIPEPEGTRTRSKSFLSQAALVLRDRTFRPFIVFRSCWTFSVHLGGSLAMIYFIKDLGFTRRMFLGVVILQVLPAVVTSLSSGWTGKLVDRLGVRKVMLGSHVVWSFLPLCWLLATKETAVYWLAAAGVVHGIGPAAAMVAASKVTLRVPVRSERAMYAAVSNCITGAIAAAAPLIAGFLLEGLKGWKAVFLGREVGGFHVIFFASFLLRLLSTLLAARVPEPKPYSDEFAPV